MSSVKKLMFSSLRGLAVAVLLTMTNGTLFAQDAAAGEKLFKENCARCHYVTDQKFVGPGLKGIRDRWKDEGNLIAWIKNSSEYLKTGDKYAVALYEEYGKQQMPAFTNLSDGDVQSILAYIDNPPAPATPVATDGTGTDGAAASPAAKDNNNMIFILIGAAIILLILARSLSGVSKAMANVNREKEGMPALPEDKPFDFFRNLGSWMARNKKITGIVVIVIVAFGAYKGFVALNDIGVYTGYEPTQPIAFSHKLHVGQNGIQCQYCHSGVEKSKHANIPSSNVCMNCHKAVNEGPTYGKKEITKIYAAIGWNPKEGKYFENYASMKKEDVRKVFADWLKDTPGAIEEVETQIQKPVEWVQIHNLPDHAFFSHAQHVKVGKVECETCHGKVEEMEKVYQYSPLTMGWCINCHRETEVQYADNGYYERLHEYYKKHYGEYEMKEGQRFTVEKIGGLECSKCHY